MVSCIATTQTFVAPGRPAMSVEHLLSMLSPQSVNPARLIEGSRSTLPSRLCADDVRAALASLPPLLRGSLLINHTPDSMPAGDAAALVLALRAEITVRTRRHGWRISPAQVDAAISVVLAEVAAPVRLCRHCDGLGVLLVMADGQSIHCEACDGSGRARWSARRRARAAKIPSATWACRVEPVYKVLIRVIEQSSREAQSALHLKIGK